MMSENRERNQQEHERLAQPTAAIETGPQMLVEGKTQKWPARTRFGVPLLRASEPLSFNASAEAPTF